MPQNPYLLYSFYSIMIELLHMYCVQCRHLIPALNAWAACAKYTTACPIATQFPGHGCMDDLTTKRSFDSQTTWVVGMLSQNILKCYAWLFIQPGIGGRLVDWCMN